MRSDATTVDAYLAELPDDRRAVVSRVREVVSSAMPPGYVETVAWGMITWSVPLERYPHTYNGQPLGYVALAAQKRHYSLYLMGLFPGSDEERELRERWAATGRRLDMGKSCWSSAAWTTSPSMSSRTSSPRCRSSGSSRTTNARVRAQRRSDMALTVESKSFPDGSLIPGDYASRSRKATARPPRAATGARTCSGPAHRTAPRSYAVVVHDEDVPADPTNAGVPGTVIERDAAPPGLRPPPARRRAADRDGARRGRALRRGAVRRQAARRQPGRRHHRGSTTTRAFFAGHEELGGTYGGYDGPFPPPNDERLHHYHFTVYALDVETLGLDGGFALDDVRRAMAGHVLASGEWTGVYTLNRDVRQQLDG
jgi:phosphatidylethanolamine-binding protein (PEBP) family uncharacterized protein